MWVIASDIVLCNITMAQLTTPLVIVEYVMYSDARIKTQLVANMPVVSASVRLEYRITTLNARALASTGSGPLTILCEFLRNFCIIVKHGKTAGRFRERELRDINRLVSCRVHCESGHLEGIGVEWNREASRSLQLVFRFEVVETGELCRIIRKYVPSGTRIPQVSNKWVTIRKT